jgi:hypothetical protein
MSDFRTTYLALVHAGFLLPTNHKSVDHNYHSFNLEVLEYLNLDGLRNSSTVLYEACFKSICMCRV